MASEKEFVLGSKRGFAVIKHHGTYDVGTVLDAMKSELNRRKYFTVNKEHTEAGKPGDREYRIDLEAMRKINDYLKFVILIEFYIFHQRDVVVEEDGEQVNKQEGEMLIRFKAHMEKDWDNVFKSWWQKILQKVYQKYVDKATMNRYWGKLFEEVNQVMDAAKEALGRPTR